MLINAASSYFLQKEDHLTWAKFAELKVAYALLQPSKINTPAQALALRKDLLRLQLIKAINKGQEKRIIHFAKIWTSEFTMDIEPVLILHKYQLPYSAKLLQLKTDLFNDRWSKLSKHLTQHPKASIQLNEIAWMGASCFQNLDKASDYAERAYNCSKQAAHLDTWAQCLYATGKINKAVELLQECVKLEPNVSYFSQKLTLWKNHLSAQE
jgi:tetratricopeptide (TPR) repeat protein